MHTEGLYPHYVHSQVYYMTEVTIKTNNQPRRLLLACEFSGAERTKLREQFDWMSDEEFDLNCSFFSGVLIKLCDDGDVIMGRYCS